MTSFDFEQLYRISTQLQKQHLDWNRTLQQAIALAGEAVAVQRGALITFQEDHVIDRVFVLANSDDGQTQDRPLWNTLLNRGIVGTVYHGARTVVIRNMQTDPRWPDTVNHAVFEKGGSVIGLPIMVGARTAAVLLLMHPQIDYFTVERCTLLQEVTRIISLNMANARKLHEASNGDTRYQTLFEHSLVPIILTNGDGIINDVNYQASEFLGFSRTDLTGIPVQDINIAAVTEYGINALDDGEETYFRTSLFDVDGQEIPTLIRTRRLKMNGEIILEWMLQDMSAQMELEQLRKDLTAMVYHDLRGPLTNLLMSVGKLNEVLDDHENKLISKLLGLGLRSARQLQRMIESLLDIQRLEERKAILDRKATPMHTLFNDVVQLVQAIAMESEQTLIIDVDDEVPALLVDVDMVTRVLVNLVENAIKYTPEGGDIKLTAHMRGHYAVLSVVDSGPGIPEAMRLRVFDKFSRVKYENAPKGVGLGLAFCRLAVEAHGGHIWVDSDGHRGSAFRFTLPLYPTGIDVDETHETLFNKATPSSEGDDVASTA